MITKKLLFIGLAFLLIFSPLAGCDLIKSSKFKTVPRPSPFPLEIDQFPQSMAKVAIITPTGQQLIAELTGPTIVHVFFEGESEGEARDDDGNGLDEVSTEIVEMTLTGMSPMGKVVVRQNPDMPSIGVIEETINKTPGILDLSPFTTEGSANSWFDVYFELEAGEFVFRTTKPKRMQTVIWHKPPQKGDTYENPEWIPLVDLYGQPTGFFVGPASHTPDPLPPLPPEIDQFPQSVAKVTLIPPTKEALDIDLTGPTIVHVFFEGESEGEARDDDGNGLDEVSTEIVEMTLTGMSPMGKVVVRQNPDMPSIGVIEETINKTPGILDLPPFTTEGSANSWFDVYFELEAGEFVFRTTKPKRMQTVIWHKPPQKGDTYENPEWIPLVDLYGQPTGFFVGPATHIPDPILEYGLSIECWPQCIPTATGATLYFKLSVRDLTNGQAPIVAVAIYIDGIQRYDSGAISEIVFPPRPDIVFTRETDPGLHTIRVVATNAHGQKGDHTWEVYCGGELIDQPLIDQPLIDQPLTPGPICPDCGNPIEQCTCQ